jgi:hypothetical protein
MKPPNRSKIDLENNTEQTNFGAEPIKRCSEASVAIDSARAVFIEQRVLRGHVKLRNKLAVILYAIVPFEGRSSVCSASFHQDGWRGALRYRFPKAQSMEPILVERTPDRPAKR